MKTAKCNMCGREQDYLHWPEGWIQTGRSKYGKQYDPDGVAWWCPEHIDQNKHNCPHD